MEPAVVTFRPDNFLTVGLIVLIVFTAAVLAAQVAMRAGLIAGSTTSNMPAVVAA